jgi:uncharacterized FlaG/YvyC family protein
LDRKISGGSEVNISPVDIAGNTNISQTTATVSMKPIDTSLPVQETKGDETINAGQVKKIVQQMQSHLDNVNVSLQYYFYGKHNQKIAIKVVNKETGAVIREIPPKEMQALQTRMSELCGIIFNGKC